MAFGNPMDYFQAGLAGGRARSPVSGVGGAIRGILDNARKKGLLETQMMGNLATAVGTEAFKQRGLQERLTAAGARPEPEFFKDKATGKTGIRNWTYDENTGQWVPRITPASFNLFESLGIGGGGGSDLSSQLQQILDNLDIR